MIQDAAAKCRFCGEWLDPTKRPDWAQPAASASLAPDAVAQAGGRLDAGESPSPAQPAPVMGAPAPVRGTGARDPAATTTDGSLHRPRRRGTQTWSAPAWMAHDDESSSEMPVLEDSEPRGPTPTRLPQPAAFRPVTPTATPPVAPTFELLATPAPAAPPVEHTIDDVAERMRRIKESAAAVRQAMLREADALQSDVLADEDPVEAAVTMHAGARASALLQEPTPQPPPDMAAMLGDDFGDLDGDDDDLDDDLDAFADEAPVRARAKPIDDVLDDVDDVDDALPPKAAAGALDGFGFDDDFDDDDDDDNFDGDFGDVGAGRPIPWKPVALGVAVALVLGVGFFWDRIFPSETLEADPAGEEANQAKDGEATPAAEGQVAQGSIAPTPGLGQPVVPEGQQPAAVGAVPVPPPAVDPAATAVDPAAAAVDPAAAAVDPAAAAAAPVPAGASAPLPPDAAAILGEARDLWTQAGKKRLGQAKEKLQGILDTHPNSADALLLMAQVQLELGEFEESLQSASRCTTVGPQTADCWLTIGVLKQNAKDKPAAAAAYERYLALAPEGAYAGDAKKQLSRLR